MNLARLLGAGITLGAIACSGVAVPSHPSDDATAPSTIDAPLYANSYLGETPPALDIPSEHWFNAETAPTLEDLRGKVVWLEFSFST